MNPKSVAMKIFRADDLNLFRDRTVFTIPYKDRKGCYFIISFGEDKHLCSIIGDDLRVHSVMTFFYDNGNGVGTEWEPCYGPISSWEECTEDWEGEDVFGQKVGARAHWFYPWVKDLAGMWSQLAVDRERLKENLLSGKIDAIFDVLQEWANRK